MSNENKQVPGFTNAAYQTLIGLDVSDDVRAALEGAHYHRRRNIWDVDLTEEQFLEMLDLLRAEVDRNPLSIYK